MNSQLKLQPSILIIFGITGDLAQRKVLPALYSLCRDQILHPDTRIVGISRQDITSDNILATIRQSVEQQGRRCEQAVLDHLRRQISSYRKIIAERFLNEQTGKVLAVRMARIQTVASKQLDNRAVNLRRSSQVKQPVQAAIALQEFF